MFGIKRRADKEIINIVNLKKIQKADNSCVSMGTYKYCSGASVVNFDITDRHRTPLTTACKEIALLKN